MNDDQQKEYEEHYSPDGEYIQYQMENPEMNDQKSKSKQDILNAFREEIAELEHEQWMMWAREVAREEKISSKRLLRWGDYLIPYKDLPEDVKEHDRKWADKILNILLTTLTEFEREVRERDIIVLNAMSLECMEEDKFDIPTLDEARKRIEKLEKEKRT